MKKGIKYGILAAVAVLLFLIGNRIGVLFNLAEGNFLERFNGAISERFFSLSLQETLKHTNGDSAIFGFVLLGIVVAFYLYNFGFRKNTRPGEEQGSARWAEPDEAAPFMDRDEKKNIILSDSTRLALSNKGKDYKYHTNKNILVIGGSGSGKTRFYVKPNLLQKHSCYVVTDPKKTCLPEVGNALKDTHKIYLLDTINLEQSMGFDPLHYCTTEADILRTADNIILNTKKSEKASSEQFWEDGEKLAYVSIMALIVFYAEYEHEKNFETFLELFDLLDAREENPNAKTALDILFDELEEEHPGNFASRAYRDFCKAPNKTAGGILITAASRLMPFNITAMRQLFRKDEMELDKIGFEKTAHFLAVDDTDSTFDFYVGLFYSTLLTRLIRNANKNKGALPIHTRLIMDEAANIAQVRNIHKVTAQVRSRNISIDMIYQNPQQLKAMYKEQAAVIEGNFDTLLFLGSEEKEVGKMISEKIGHETVIYKTASQNRGQNTSYSVSEQQTRRMLLEADEVRRFPVDECIVFIKGLPPIRDKKYSLEKHPHFAETADYSEELRFDLPAHLARQKFSIEPRRGPTVEVDVQKGNTRFMEIAL